MVKSAESIPVSGPTEHELEIAYAQNTLFDIDREASRVSSERRAAEQQYRKLTAGMDAARTVLGSLLEKSNSSEREQYYARIAALFGVGEEGLEKDEVRTIFLDDETLATYLEMASIEDARAEKAAIEIEKNRFGRQVHDRESHRDFHARFAQSMIDAQKKLTPGTAFVSGMSASTAPIRIVAGEDSEESAASVIARIQQGNYGRGYSWRIGIQVPVVGEDNPLEIFSTAPDFNIDEHIKDLIAEYDEKMGDNEASPVDLMELEKALARVGDKSRAGKAKTRLMTQINKVIEGTTTRRDYSPERLREFIDRIRGQSPNRLEKALDVRAERAARFFFNVRDGKTYGLDVDDARLVMGDALSRLPEGATLTHEILIDAYAHFLKRGFALLDAKKQN